MVESKEETRLFTRKEVSENASRENVVIVYDDSVYNVTSYIFEHPGGEEVLFEINGKDATESFNDVGHSTDAREIMKKFKIGELVDSEKTATTQKAKPTTSANDSGFSFDMKDWKLLLPTALTVLAVAYYMYYKMKNPN